MVSVCLPSDALSQHLSSYLGFSYLGRGVSLHGCSSKAQPLLLTLDDGCLLTTAPPDLECGVAPLGLPVPMQPCCLHVGLLLSASTPTFNVGSCGDRRAKRSYSTFKVRRCSHEEIPLVQGMRNPSKMVGVARGHQRADTMKP